MLAPMLTFTLVSLIGCGTAGADPAAAVLVSGSIEAPADAPAAQAVFVSLRKPGVPGPPLAARKLPAGPFPLSFVLTEADRPMVQGPVPEDFEIKVTLDIDGDPMSKSEADLEVVQAATKGATGLKLSLAPRP